MDLPSAFKQFDDSKLQQFQQFYALQQQAAANTNTDLFQKILQENFAKQQSNIIVFVY